MDPIATFKERQKEGWRHFVLTQERTAPAAAQLVRHAGIRAGQQVLDVACGTGVVAITAARRGAQVTGLDLTPELLERATENAELSAVTVTWIEGDVEDLPFPPESFDVVTSQFGHMFAPQPEIALAEMLRVLKRGGTLAFATWPPYLFMGRMFRLVGRYAPPPPGIISPALWGDPNTVRERLGAAVDDIAFHTGALRAPALTPQHFRAQHEKSVGPIIKIVDSLAESDPEKLAAFRRDYDALIAEYFDDNIVTQDYLITTSVKK